MLKINLLNCCTFSFVWKQVNLFNVVLTTRRTPRICWAHRLRTISMVLLQTCSSLLTLYGFPLGVQSPVAYSGRLFLQSQLRCWGDSNPRISAVTGRHPNQLNDSTVYRETKTKCVTITPYIGTYKPMQQDSNPHLSFYLKKNCRKIAVSFPIFRTFLMICHHPKSRTWKLAIYLRWGLPQVFTPLVMIWAARSVSWRLSLFSLLLIFFLVSRHLFPCWYSHRFIRILTVTLSVTHINVLTITTCLGVPTTLYPHYCRHAPTQDCGSGRTRTCDPKINSLLR